MSLAPSARPHAIHLMTSPYSEAYHMTKLFGAGKVGGGWATKHVVSVPPSTPRSAAIFLPAAARNVLPQSHTPFLCSRNRFQLKDHPTGCSMAPVAMVGRWVEGGSQCSCSARVPPTSGPCHTGYRGAVQRWRPWPENAGRATSPPGWRGGAAPSSAPAAANPHTHRPNTTCADQSSTILRSCPSL